MSLLPPMRLSWASVSISLSLNVVKGRRTKLISTKIFNIFIEKDLFQALDEEYNVLFTIIHTKSFINICSCPQNCVTWSVQYEVKSSEVSFRCCRHHSICISVNMLINYLLKSMFTIAWHEVWSVHYDKSSEVSFRCNSRRSIHISVKRFFNYSLKSISKHFHITRPQLYDMKWNSGLGLQRPSFNGSLLLCMN